MTFYKICNALPQNREQVKFWVKWVFDIIVTSSLSALIWYQNQVHTPTFWDMTICVCRPWECDFEKLAFKVSNSYIVLDMTGCRKSNFFLGGGCLKINQKIYGAMEDILRYIKKQESQNWQTSHFPPLCYLQLPISQNRPVWLVPCFVVVHHKYALKYLEVLLTHSFLMLSAIDSIQILTALRGTVKIIDLRWCQNQDYARSEAEGIAMVFDITEGL